MNTNINTYNEYHINTYNEYHINTYNEYHINTYNEYHINTYNEYHINTYSEYHINTYSEYHINTYRCFFALVQKPLYQNSTLIEKSKKLEEIFLNVDLTKNCTQNIVDGNKEGRRNKHVTI